MKYILTERDIERIFYDGYKASASPRDIKYELKRCLKRYTPLQKSTTSIFSWKNWLNEMKEATKNKEAND